MWNTSPSGWTGTAGHVWLLQSSPVWPPECTLEWQACLHWTSRRGFLPWRRQWKSHNWWTGLGTASRQTAQLPVSKGGGGQGQSESVHSQSALQGKPLLDRSWELTELLISGSDTMTWALWSQTILQKSFMVAGRGFWVTMNSLLRW